MHLIRCRCQFLGLSGVDKAGIVRDCTVLESHDRYGRLSMDRQCMEVYDVAPGLSMMVPLREIADFDGGNKSAVNAL